LIASTSYCLGFASLSTFSKTNKVNANLYTGLVAFPSAGKTPAIDFLKNALINIENYYQVPLSKSGISESSEIIDHLSELDRPNLIGILIFCIIEELRS
jgi:hypothetical protein